MLSKNQLKEIQALQLKKHRDLRQLFIAEGAKTVVEVMTQFPALIDHVYATSGFLQQNKQVIFPSQVSYTEVSEEELSKISLQSNPNQVLAVCRYFETVKVSYQAETDFSFYLDDIRDPGNMGTIIRLADWFGVKTIFCSRETCDIYNPKVIQSTMGAFLRVQVVYIGLSDLIKQFSIKHVYGAVLEGHNIYQEKLLPGLIVIGNEANGIRPENRVLLNRLLTIPRHPESAAESLNAAVATSIIASEFYRQLKS